MTITTVPWAKRQPDGQSLSVVDHCLDVACVLRLLLERPLIARLPRLDPVHRDRLAVLAFLHDFGKCNRGFQAKGLPGARETAGHTLEAAALLTQWHDLWPTDWCALLQDLATWFRSEEQAVQMLLASLSHHGRPISFEHDIERFLCSNAGGKSKVFWQPADGDDPQAALASLARAARSAFPQAFSPDATPIDATPALQQRFAGLVMLADWIASDTQFFPYATPSGLSRQEFARQSAHRALRAIGVTPPEQRMAKPFAEVFGFAPTPLQAALARKLIPGDDTRLLLLESDTGSGKTEAALAWFLRLYAEGHVDGLYFALPTRVAACELYGRVLRAVETAFAPDQCPRPVLLAAPGYVKVDGQTIHHVLPDSLSVLWDEDKADQRRERLWAAERPKRFLAAPIAVGTLDQALLSVLQVKHSLLRSVCLDRHLLVVDEVHASDPYMREVLQALLRGHLARGGWALLLSATLGEAAAAAYFERPVEPLPKASQRPYPLLTSRVQALHWPSTRQRRIRVECLPHLANDAALLSALTDALQRGARILVVCNTVSRANTLFRRIESRLARDEPALLGALFSLAGVRCPHHGRFAREDRERLDANVTACLGKGTPDGPLLLIGTQTLEQSLDIDADWLVTDLAPMDVLIQRLGRLHRHERTNRPSAYAQPRALVCVPEQPLSAYLTKDNLLRGPAGLGSVYPDGRVLVLTWQSLVSEPELVLPDQARRRIEACTHPESFARLPDPWSAHGAAIEGKELGEIRQALRSVLEDKPFGELHYPDTGERVLTRLGEPTFEIPLARPMSSAFGTPITRVALPARWLSENAVPDEVAAEATTEGFRFSIGAMAFRYTRFGLEKDDV